MTEPSSTEIVPAESPARELATQRLGSLSVDDLVAHVDLMNDASARVMREGVHFGKIPGTDKPTLLKPGAELLVQLFRLEPRYTVTESRNVIPDSDHAHLDVIVTCTLYHAPTGMRLGDGLGSCTTRESKYAWRQALRVCPKCGADAIIKGKEEWGGGWKCWAKKGGCGVKFDDGDPAVEGQSTGRVPNPDLADCENSVRKIACKRALVAAALVVTGASSHYTQDLEDGTNATSAANTNQGPAKPAKPAKPVGARAVSNAMKAIADADSLPRMHEIKLKIQTVTFAEADAEKISTAFEARLAELREHSEGDSWLEGDGETEPASDEPASDEPPEDGAPTVASCLAVVAAAATRDQLSIARQMIEGLPFNDTARAELVYAISKRWAELVEAEPASATA